MSKISKKVISAKQLPTHLPILSTIVYFLLLKQVNAGEIWYGVYFTVMAILWITAIILICNQESIEVDL